MNIRGERDANECPSPCSSHPTNPCFYDIGHSLPEHRCLRACLPAFFTGLMEKKSVGWAGSAPGGKD